ncbi:MAG: Bug family tripartite tricarboxylate transporter substrate binding protein [Flavobacteriaceae bacterium]
MAAESAKRGTISRRAVLAGGLAVAAVPRRANAASGGLDLVVPGAAGSGWDQFARALADSLLGAGLIQRAEQTYLAGAHGDRAVAEFAAGRRGDAAAVLVHSSPLLIADARSMPVFGSGELVPIAGMVDDPAVVAVRPGMADGDFTGLLANAGEADDPVSVVGGSPPGGMDHLVLLAALREAGIAETGVVYRGGDGGGAALASLIAGDADIFCGGLGEAITAARNGAVRIVAIADDRRNADLPEAATLTEQGVPLVFRNWRAVYGSPGLTREDRDRLRDLFAMLDQTPEWADARAALGWRRRFSSGTDFIADLAGHREEMSAFLRRAGFR